MTQVSRRVSAPDEQPAFKVSFECGAGDIGTANECSDVIDDQEFRMKRRARRPDSVRPAEPGGVKVREWMGITVEVGIIGWALQN